MRKPVLLLTLAVAACGGGGGDDDTAPDAMPDADANPGTPPTLCGAPAPANVLFDPGLTHIERIWGVGHESLVAAGDHTWKVWLPIGPTGLLAAQGEGTAVAAGADTIILVEEDWIEMCSTFDGRFLGALPGASIGLDRVDPESFHPGISSDDSYAWLPVGDRLVVVSLDGTIRFTVDDLPAGAAVHSSSGGRLRVDGGGVLRTFDVSNGAALTSAPIAGRITRWFEGDDERFLALDGATVRVYDESGAQLAAFTPGFTATDASGHGDLVAARSETQLAFHRIGGGAAPIATEPVPLNAAFAGTADRFAIASEPFAGGVAIDEIRLDGTTLARAHLDLGDPPVNVTEPSITAVSDGWAVALTDGIVARISGDLADPTISVPSQGRITTIVGARSQVVIGTEAGVTYIDALPGSLPVRVARFGRGTVALSDDSLRAAITTDQGVRIETPDGLLVDTIPPGDATAEIVDAAFSPDHDVLTLVRETGVYRFQRSLYRLADDVETPLGDAIDGESAFSMRPLVAPGLAMVALPDLQDSSEVQARRTHLVAADGAAIATVEGLPVGWLDADTLVVDSSTAERTQITRVSADGTIGNTLVLDLDQLGQIRPRELRMWLLGGDRLLAPDLRVYSLLDGHEIPFDAVDHIGPMPDRSGAAVAGGHLVYGMWWGPVFIAPLPR